MTVTFDAIKQAAEAIKGNLIRTPTVECLELGKLIQGKVYLKLESLQVTNSFKPRGALIKMRQLTATQQQRGVVAMSAGNHAQGVAYHAHKLGIPATIIMPTNTPVAKIERTQALGATVVLSGENLSEAGVKAQELIAEAGFTLIHPYDDPAIIAGQGTVALEMLEDIPALDTLIIPVGGGGLAAGMSIVAKTLKPDMHIYGVQSTYCPAMIQAIYPERWFMPPDAGTLPLAEGIAVKQPGVLTQSILKEKLHDMIGVSEDHIEAAIDYLLTHVKVVAEGAGASGIAALLTEPELFSGKTVGVVICGANVDARILSSVVLRSLVRQGKMVRLKIQIYDAPGVLSKLSKIIGENGGNIFEINHQRLFSLIGAKMAEVDAVIETRNVEHAQKIIEKLQEGGFPTRLLD
ncbi:threonine ammonia-lyase [Candidatus Paracaedibacter symbiosus]|uniref:threonine ammonia-lyase n=1 Tax=Candidatus Paracaedibacter symbiosus TaxID=244582 RepID=UPI000509DE0D|nr:threonine ammonia-lyase [Candidatus Paracaedibacter symbiosus]